MRYWLRQSSKRSANVPQLHDLRWWLLTHLGGVSHVDECYRSVLVISAAIFLVCTLTHSIPASAAQGHFITGLRSDGLYLFFLSAFIIAGRWPGLLAGQLNPDEGQFLAGAQKLLHDPVYWRSVDTGSSGPLNVYPLMVSAVAGFHPDYATARLLGVVLIIVSCLCLYFALSCLYSTWIARAALVPVVSTWALMTATDYVHYSSEHVSIALTSIALYFVCRFASGGAKAEMGQLILIGLILGALPYAKLQATPIAAILGVICLHLIWSRRSSLGGILRGVLSLVGGTACVSLFHLLAVAHYSLLHKFFMSYVVQNLHYSTSNASVSTRLANLVRLITWEKATQPLFGLTAVLLAVGTFLLLALARKGLCRGRAEAANCATGTECFLVYGILLLVASIYSVAQPQRLHIHYALFLILPSGFVLGTVLGELQNAARRELPAASICRFASRSILIAFFAVSLLQIGVSLTSDNPYLVNRQRYLEQYLSPVARAILEYASPGDTIAIWGWSPELFVETGTLHATCESIPFWQFHPNPQQPYFIKRYVDELRGSNPTLFVDTQVPGSQNRSFGGTRGQSFTELPEIAEFVQRHFTVVRRIHGITIYARKKDGGPT